MTDEQIKKVIKETLLQMGLDTCDPNDMQQDLVFLRRLRLVNDSIGRKTILTVVGIIVAGIAALCWMAIRKLCGT